MSYIRKMFLFLLIFGGLSSYVQSSEFKEDQSSRFASNRTSTCGCWCWLWCSCDKKLIRSSIEIPIDVKTYSKLRSIRYVVITALRESLDIIDNSYRVEYAAAHKEGCSNRSMYYILMKPFSADAEKILSDIYDFFNKSDKTGAFFTYQYHQKDCVLAMSVDIDTGLLPSQTGPVTLKCIEDPGEFRELYRYDFWWCVINMVQDSLEKKKIVALLDKNRWNRGSSTELCSCIMMDALRLDKKHPWQVLQYLLTQSPRRESYRLTNRHKESVLTLAKAREHENIPVFYIFDALRPEIKARLAQKTNLDSTYTAAISSLGGQYLVLDNIGNLVDAYERFLIDGHESLTNLLLDNPFFQGTIKRKRQKAEVLMSDKKIHEREVLLNSFLYMQRACLRQAIDEVFRPEAVNPLLAVLARTKSHKIVAQRIIEMGRDENE